MTPLSFLSSLSFVSTSLWLNCIKKCTVYCSFRPFSTTPKGLCQGEEHGCEQERFKRDHEIKETCEGWGPGECEHFLKCLYILLLTHTLKPRGYCYLYIATEQCI